VESPRWSRSPLLARGDTLADAWHKSAEQYLRDGANWHFD
jgi:hypothetical protein